MGVRIGLDRIIFDVILVAVVSVLLVLVDETHIFMAEGSVVSRTVTSTRLRIVVQTGEVGIVHEPPIEVPFVAFVSAFSSGSHHGSVVDNRDREKDAKRVLKEAMVMVEIDYDSDEATVGLVTVGVRDMRARDLDVVRPVRTIIDRTKGLVTGSGLFVTVPKLGVREPVVAGGFIGGVSVDRLHFEVSISVARGRTVSSPFIFKGVGIVILSRATVS